MNGLWAYIRLQRANRWYPWLVYLKGDIATLFISWLGLAGGAIQFLWQLLQEKNGSTPLTRSQAAKIPARGLIGGFIVTLTVVAVPMAFDVSGPSGLAGLAFFAGMFSDTAYTAVKRFWEGQFGKPSS